ncbi:hypothetical protein [Burkholderia pseudomallei]|uniref:hypothetical protein n=1 Tax=Burkholderia pseudomallei TaxID=28450 RepID=UPI00016AAE56|nr:hypothetical protein [Burkholderia pseudomallei]AIV75411.1 putative gp24 [Burkholderia pseudomallei]APY94901.1 hypothetical protein BGI50_17985 [Burkholderia pseudomallei]KGC53601.1 putative gp24 [Burkholderia pseudomallei]KGC57992.1 putative gp24 [Burkholderia pseudomallei]KGD32556.1 putative gp24 [Burkholderia pseudomallei]
MTKNEQNVMRLRTPQQVAADLFRIGEKPDLPAWCYPSLAQAIALLTGDESATVAVYAAPVLTGVQRAAVEFALGMCCGHIAGERHVPALESILSGTFEQPEADGA